MITVLNRSFKAKKNYFYRHPLNMYCKGFIVINKTGVKITVCFTQESIIDVYLWSNNAYT